MAAQRFYHKELTQLIEANQLTGTKPKLLLHCCCGPCATYTLNYLSPYFAITAYYYNPNIHPKAEYDQRLMELKKVIKQVQIDHPVDLVVSDYLPDPYHRAVAGLTQLGEGSARCEACIQERLEETAARAVAWQMDYFASTLSISPHKNAWYINTTGDTLAQTYGISHLPNDFKKAGGFQRAAVLCKQWDIARQTYCGCIYSQQERIRQQKE